MTGTESGALDLRETGLSAFHLPVRLMVTVKASSLNSPVLITVESRDVEEELIPHGGT